MLPHRENQRFMAIYLLMFFPHIHQYTVYSFVSMRNEVGRPTCLFVCFLSPLVCLFLFCHLFVVSSERLPKGGGRGCLMIVFNLKGLFCLSGITCVRVSVSLLGISFWSILKCMQIERQGACVFEWTRARACVCMCVCACVCVCLCVCVRARVCVVTLNC